MMRSLLLLLVCFDLSVYAQSGVLEDFSSMRTNGLGAGPCNTTTQANNTSNCLWPGNSNEGPTTCVISSNTLVCTTQGTAPWGLATWIATLHVDSTTGYDDIASYIQSRIRSGTWTTAINRLRFSYKCSVDVAATTSGNHWLEFGTYVRHPDESDPPHSGQGQHFYHFLSQGSKANEWVYAEFNQRPQHRVGEAGSTDYLVDPEWTETTLSIPVHYFDGMTHFYWGATYATELRASGVSCSFGQWTFATVTGGADSYVSSIAGAYNEVTGKYDVSWNAPKHITGGITYELRYKTSSMRTAGWSTGTDGGTVTGEDDSPYTGVLYSSPLVGRSSQMFVGIRPRMKVASATVSGTVRLNTHKEHWLQTGDTVSVASVCAAANGARTITVIDGDTVSLDGTSGSCSYSSGGIVTATSETANFAELLVGDESSGGGSSAGQRVSGKVSTVGKVIIQ